MLGDIVMINDQEEGKSQINNIEFHDINRGFELMLRHGSKIENNPKPKKFGIMVEKCIFFLKNNIHFKFEISFAFVKNK